MAEDEDASDSGSTASSSRPPSPRGQWWPERAPAQLSPASVDHLAQAESWTAGAAARVAAALLRRVEAGDEARPRKARRTARRAPACVGLPADDEVEIRLERLR